MIDCPVYRAEHISWGRCPAFRSVVPAPAAFVEYVTTREPFLSLRRAAKLPEQPVTVTSGAPQRTCVSVAHLKEQHIDLARGVAPTQGLLLHEIAHLCSPMNAHHDHRYVANYLRLVHEWLGQHCAEDLLAAMRDTKAFPCAS